MKIHYDRDCPPALGEPVAVIGSSVGMFGAVWAQAELRKVLAAMGARVAEVELAIGRVKVWETTKTRTLPPTTAANPRASKRRLRSSRNAVA